MKKRDLIFRSSLMCGCLLFLSQAVSAAENYADWPKSKDITINTSATGYNVTSTIAKFHCGKKFALIHGKCPAPLLGARVSERQRRRG